MPYPSVGTNLPPNLLNWGSVRQTFRCHYVITIITSQNDRLGLGIVPAAASGILRWDVTQGTECLDMLLCLFHSQSTPVCLHPPFHSKFPLSEILTRINAIERFETDQVLRHVFLRCRNRNGSVEISWQHLQHPRKKFAEPIITSTLHQTVTTLSVNSILFSIPPLP